MELKTLFETAKTIAIAGCSPDPDKPSHRVAKYLQSAGFKILPIYPKNETILGEEARASLAEIAETVDIVVMFRKPSAADALLDEILKRGDIRAFWLQEGIVNDAVKDRAVQNGLYFAQDLCIMKEREKIYGDN